MSKFTKLVNNPREFFGDAIRKKSPELHEVYQSAYGRALTLGANVRRSLPSPEVQQLDYRQSTVYLVGFSPWKQFMVSWLADKQVVFLPVELNALVFNMLWSRLILKSKRAELMVWGMNLPSFIADFAKKHKIPVQYVEDGFLRSIELGSKKSAPFSLTFDKKAPHYDANRASDLEDLLATYDFDAHPELMQRAHTVMAALKETGLSKYNYCTNISLNDIYGPKNQKRILVLGQVEDDASIKYGSNRPYSNIDLIKIARMENPDAQIIYKPHPEVLCGTRASRSNPNTVKHLCQILEHDVPLSDALISIDHVYTITSQAGFEALMRGIKVTTLGCPFYSGWGLTDDRQPNVRRNRKLSVEQVFAGAYLLYVQYFDPVYKTYITAEQALSRLCALRQGDEGADLLLEHGLPSASRADTARPKLWLYRFSTWKESFIHDFFSENDVEFITFKVSEAAFAKEWAERIVKEPGDGILVWGMHAPDHLEQFAAENNIAIRYAEDGFIRSIGLGVTHTPPLSMTIDRYTPYFNAREASDLEKILSHYDFDAHPELLARSRALIDTLLDSGLSKYNQSNKLDNIETVYGPKTRKRVLVIGQVEDDASIQYGCERKYSNNDLVTIAYLENPDAQIIYKPHPDVLHKARAMLSNPDEVRHISLVLDMDIPLSQSFETVDHVYTITSQAGFEALMRGIKVTAMGCPFYAGWGLTDDRQPNARRNRQLSVEAVFAGAYILYTRYYDPVYKVRVTPEDALARLQQMRAAQAKEVQPETALAVVLVNSIAAPELLLPDGVKPKLWLYRFSTWKESFIHDFFSANDVVFMTFKMTLAAFKEQWMAKILAEPGDGILVWGMHAPDYVKKFAAENNIAIRYAEDGFIRSIGLGVTHTPPLSMTIDRYTPYFNAREASDLEKILSHYDFDAHPELLARSRALIDTLLDSGLSKYNQSNKLDNIETVYGPKTRKRVLVIGQVEDDASIQYGCERKYSNNDLVTIAYLENPDAQIIYKPHPDVLHKARAMLSNPDEVRHISLVLDMDIPLSQSFETVDHVYTITSQAGFEALMRGIKVTAMGCPFYAGWGLTDDRQPNARRNRQLSVEAVFAGAYILYTRYYDPVYRKRVELEDALSRLGSMRALITQAALESVTDAPLSPAWFIGESYHGAQRHAQVLLVDYELEGIPADITDRDFDEQWAAKLLERKAVCPKVFVWVPALTRHVRNFLSANDFDVSYVDVAPYSRIYPDSRYIGLTVDHQGSYRQARAASDMDGLLRHYNFEQNPAVLQEAKILLRQYLAVTATEHTVLPEARKTVLVIAEAVSGFDTLSGQNRGYNTHDLMTMAMLENPEARIVLYVPEYMAFVDQPAFNAPDVTVHHAASVDWFSVINQADVVYTVASVFGLDAVLRAKVVHTLGQPFYAGWGLTVDHDAKVYRNRQLTLEQLFAIVHLNCTTYLDTVYKREVLLKDIL